MDGLRKKKLKTPSFSDSTELSDSSSLVPIRSIIPEHVDELEGVQFEDKTMFDARSSVGSDSSVSYPSREPSLLEELRAGLALGPTADINKILKSKRLENDRTMDLSFSSSLQSLNSTLEVTLPRERRNAQNVLLVRKKRKDMTLNLTLNDTASSGDNQENESPVLTSNRPTSVFKKPLPKKMSVAFDVSLGSDSSKASIHDNSLPVIDRLFDGGLPNGAGEQGQVSTKSIIVEANDEGNTTFLLPMVKRVNPLTKRRLERNKISIPCQLDDTVTDSESSNSIANDFAERSEKESSNEDQSASDVNPGHSPKEVGESDIAQQNATSNSTYSEAVSLGCSLDDVPRSSNDYSSNSFKSSRKVSVLPHEASNVSKEMSPSMERHSGVFLPDRNDEDELHLELSLDESLQYSGMDSCMEADAEQEPPNFPAENDGAEAAKVNDLASSHVSQNASVPTLKSPPLLRRSKRGSKNVTVDFSVSIDSVSDLTGLTEKPYKNPLKTKPRLNKMSIPFTDETMNSSTASETDTVAFCRRLTDAQKASTPKIGQCESRLKEVVVINEGAPRGLDHELKITGVCLEVPTAQEVGTGGADRAEVAIEVDKDNDSSALHDAEEVHQSNLQAEPVDAEAAEEDINHSVTIPVPTMKTTLLRRSKRGSKNVTVDFSVSTVSDSDSDLTGLARKPYKNPLKTKTRLNKMSIPFTDETKNSSADSDSDSDLTGLARKPYKNPLKTKTRLNKISIPFTDETMNSSTASETDSVAFCKHLSGAQNASTAKMGQSVKEVDVISHSASRGSAQELEINGVPTAQEVGNQETMNGNDPSKTSETNHAEVGSDLDRVTDSSAAHDAQKEHQPSIPLENDNAEDVAMKAVDTSDHVAPEVSETQPNQNVVKSNEDIGSEGLAAQKKSIVAMKAVDTSDYVAPEVAETQPNQNVVKSNEDIGSEGLAAQKKSILISVNNSGMDDEVSRDSSVPVPKNQSTSAGRRSKRRYSSAKSISTVEVLNKTEKSVIAYPNVDQLRSSTAALSTDHPCGIRKPSPSIEPSSPGPSYQNDDVGKADGIMSLLPPTASSLHLQLTTFSTEADDPSNNITHLSPATEPVEMPSELSPLTNTLDEGVIATQGAVALVACTETGKQSENPEEGVTKTVAIEDDITDSINPPQKTAQTHPCQDSSASELQQTVCQNIMPKPVSISEASTSDGKNAEHNVDFIIPNSSAPKAVEIDRQKSIVNENPTLSNFILSAGPSRVTVNSDEPLPRKSKRKSVSFKPPAENLYHSPPDHSFQDRNRDGKAPGGYEFSQLMVTTDISEIRSSPNTKRAKRHFSSTPITKANPEDHMFERPQPLASAQPTNTQFLPPPPIRRVSIHPIPEIIAPQGNAGAMTDNAQGSSEGGSSSSSYDLSCENSLEISVIPKDVTVHKWGNVYHSTPLHRTKASLKRTKKKNAEQPPEVPQVQETPLPEEPAKFANHSVQTSRNLRSRSKSSLESGSASQLASRSTSGSVRRSARRNQTPGPAAAKIPADDGSSETSGVDGPTDGSPANRISIQDNTIVSTRIESQSRIRASRSRSTMGSAFKSYDSHRKIASRRLFNEKEQEASSDGGYPSEGTSSKSTDVLTTSGRGDDPLTSIVAEQPSFPQTGENASITAQQPDDFSDNDSVVSTVSTGSTNSVPSHVVLQQSFESQLSSIRSRSERRQKKDRTSQAEPPKLRSKYALKPSKKSSGLPSVAPLKKRKRNPSRTVRLFNPGPQWKKSKKLYAWLKKKLEPVCQLRTNLECERLVIDLNHARILVAKGHTKDALDFCTERLHRLGICKNQLQRNGFFMRFMPLNFVRKVVPLGGAFGQQFDLSDEASDDDEEDGDL